MSSKDLELVKNYFVNPTQPESAEDLSALSSEVVRVMAQIYAGQYSEDQDHLAQATPEPALAEVIREMLQREAGTRIFDTHFMGQIHPQGNKIGIVSNLVAAYMNNNTVVQEVSTAENIMEQEVLDRLASWFGYDPQKYSGNIVSGGSTANLAALWVSRERALAKAQSRRNANLYVLGTEMAHYSVMKACDILGPRVIYLTVPTTGYKTDVLAMERMVKQISNHQSRRDGVESQVMAIVGLAGETETGSVDDLEALADIAEAYQTHFHADAAYGGPFILSKEKSRFAGIERADSITVDPHKLLYTPYASGAILFKDARNHLLIEKDMREHARYLLNDETRSGHENRRTSRNFGMSRVEGSMGSAGVISAWATMQLLGEAGLSVILDHTLELTEFAFQHVLSSRFMEPLEKPELNTLLIGLKKSLQIPKDTYNEFIAEVQQLADQQGFYISVNGEVDHGRSALRMVIMHPHTTAQDIQAFIDLLDTEFAKKMKPPATLR